MINAVETCLKFVGSFLVGLSLAYWLGTSPYEGSNLAQIVMFAIGLTLITIKLGKK